MNKIRLLEGFLKGNFIYCDVNVKNTLFIVRKILFSWFNNCMYNFRVLDMFGGSGVLSFEALSRGASYVLIVEKVNHIYKNILFNKKRLSLKNINVINFDIFVWLNNVKNIKSYVKSFDIIFIDAPYEANYLFYCLNILLKYDLLTKFSYIYIESYVNFENEFFLFKYRIIKSRIIGNIYFYIIRKI